MHLDLLGFFHYVTYLLVTDFYTKWLEEFEINSTIASGVISKLIPLCNLIPKLHSFLQSFTVYQINFKST